MQPENHSHTCLRQWVGQLKDLIGQMAPDQIECSGGFPVASFFLFVCLFDVFGKRRVPGSPCHMGREQEREASLPGGLAKQRPHEGEGLRQPWGRGKGGRRGEGREHRTGQQSMSSLWSKWTRGKQCNLSHTIARQRQPYIETDGGKWWQKSARTPTLTTHNLHICINDPGWSIGFGNGHGRGAKVMES